jgi:hypothetical protein
VHAWIEYYSRFRHNASFPVEWLRYEDLLLHPEETTREYCGHPIGKVVLQTNATKKTRDPQKVLKVETTLASAVSMHKDTDVILAQFTSGQLEHVASILSTSDVLSFFGYHIPT